MSAMEGKGGICSRPTVASSAVLRRSRQVLRPTRWKGIIYCKADTLTILFRLDETALELVVASPIVVQDTESVSAPIDSVGDRFGTTFKYFNSNPHNR